MTLAGMAGGRSTAGDPRRRWSQIALCSFLLTCCSIGCREGADEPARTVDSAFSDRVIAEGEISSDFSRITVTDRLDRRVSFDAPPQRIVSLTPSITEVLFAVGAGDKIVGATKYCNYPPQAAELPRVGGGTLESLNQEVIIGAEPDLVLCKWDNHLPLLKNLERLGIPVLALGPETLAELYDQTRMLGRITGNLPQSERLIASMQRRVDAVTARIPTENGPTVFYQVWDDPLMTAGPNSFIGELLSLAGMRNLFEETPIRYPKVSPEVVVAGNPDVILAPSTHATPVTAESILGRAGWGGVRAVQEKRVYVIDGDSVSRCGPRLVDALEEIVGVVYPDSFRSIAPESKAGDSGESKDREP